MSRKVQHHQDAQRYQSLSLARASRNNRNRYRDRDRVLSFQKYDFDVDPDSDSDDIIRHQNVCVLLSFKLVKDYNLSQNK